MTVSSERNDSPFAGVRLKSLHVLIRLVRESAITDVQYIRRRFGEMAAGFDATLQFLSTIGGIAARDGSLTLHGNFATSFLTDEQVSGELLGLLVARSGPVRRELFRFLDNFQVIDGLAHYRPLADKRSVESDLRNLLLELAVISHEPETDVYVLDPKHHLLLMNAVRGRGSVSAKAIEEDRKDAAALGDAVERAIIRFEQLRVGQQYAHHVEHVAPADAAAGYDVLSVTVESPQTLTPRLIEVKAVPLGTLRFYWTANEVATARRFGSWYFLYLVPVRGNGQPDINALHVVNDPYGVIIEAQSAWAVVPESFKCELVVAASHGSDLQVGDTSYA